MKQEHLCKIVKNLFLFHKTNERKLETLEKRKSIQKATNMKQIHVMILRCQGKLK